MPKNIQATIDRIEEDKAVLIFEDSQKLFVPINALPKNSLAGQALEISLLPNRSKTESQETLARDVLNEILQNE